MAEPQHAPEPMAADEPVERLLTTPDLNAVAEILEAMPLKPGTVHTGTVQRVGADAVVVALPDELPAVQVPADQFSSAPMAGAELTVYVERVDDEGVAHGNLHKAARLALWDRLEAAVKEGAELEGEVISASASGVSVDVLGLKAHCARRQLGLSAGQSPEALLGQRLTFRVTGFDARKGNLALSRTAVGAGEVEHEDEPLAEGQVRAGVVKGLTHFGAFVRLGQGVEGLLPISEMSWARLGHPRELLAVGDHVQVMVLSFDPEAKKVRLGLKQLSEDPWSNADSKYAPGTRVTAPVHSVTEFGVFVELEPGVEGLVHKTELSWTRRINHPKELVKPGDLLDLVVLRVDVGHRKLGLSLKQTTDDPYAALRDQYPAGTRLKGTVSSVTDFGVFVALAEGIDGLVHKSDLTWGEATDPRELFKKGQPIEVMMLDIDAERQRISLGVKQLGPDEDAAKFEALEVGALVPVTVARVVDFGAFAALESGLEGLLHRSELDQGNVEDAREVLKVGQTLLARVVAVEPARRRISLSLKGVEQPEQPATSEATELAVPAEAAPVPTQPTPDTPADPEPPSDPEPA
ncbi:MAG: S1 RNA-binding domain-containing protein, partial [Myxococcales bacterium]|nr:S1 RNA-binding domain-containing protein [Myxococcales bacterium]